MKKSIYLLLYVCAAVFASALTACTESEGVGTFDTGKTAWEAGDEILLWTTAEGVATQHAVLTYDGETWAATTIAMLVVPAEATLHALYAPGMEFAEGSDTPVMKAGAVAGTDELIAGTATLSDNYTATISFAETSRAYSRLRIASLPLSARSTDRDTPSAT